MTSLPNTTYMTETDYFKQSPQTWNLARFSEFCYKFVPGYEDKSKRKKKANRAWYDELTAIQNDVDRKPTAQGIAQRLLSEATKDFARKQGRENPVHVHIHQHHVSVKNAAKKAPPPYNLSTAKRARSPSPERDPVKRSRPAVSPFSGTHLTTRRQRSASPSPSLGPRGSIVREQSDDAPLRQRFLRMGEKLNEVLTQINHFDKRIEDLRKARDLIDGRIMEFEWQKSKVIQDTWKPAVNQLEDLFQDPLLTQNDREMTEKDSDGGISEAETVIL